MKYTVLFSILFSLSAQAAQIKIDHADTWKLAIIPKNTQTSYMLGGADLSLTGMVHKAGVIPTVLGFNKSKARNVPRSVPQWRELIARSYPEFKPEPGARILSRGGKSRYIATYTTNESKDQSVKVFVMAMIVGEELYVFSYQGALEIYSAHYDDVFNLYRTVELKIEE